MVWAAALILAASPAAIEEARTAHIECLLAKAEQFDDGISDVISVARVIMPACHAELDRVATLMVQGAKRPERVKQILMDDLSNDPTVASQAILVVRKRRAQPALR